MAKPTGSRPKPSLPAVKGHSTPSMSKTRTPVKHTPMIASKMKATNTDTSKRRGC